MPRYHSHLSIQTIWTISSTSINQPPDTYTTSLHPFRFNYLWIISLTDNETAHRFRYKRYLDHQAHFISRVSFLKGTQVSLTPEQQEGDYKEDTAKESSRSSGRLVLDTLRGYGCSEDGHNLLQCCSRAKLTRALGSNSTSLTPHKPSLFEFYPLSLIRD